MQCPHFRKEEGRKYIQESVWHKVHSRPAGSHLMPWAGCQTPHHLGHLHRVPLWPNPPTKPHSSNQGYPGCSQDESSHSFYIFSRALSLGPQSHPPGLHWGHRQGLLKKPCILQCPNPTARLCTGLRGLEKPQPQAFPIPNLWCPLESLGASICYLGPHPRWKKSEMPRQGPKHW